MSRTVTTHEGVFNYVEDAQGHKWFLWRCPKCEAISTLTEDSLLEGCNCPKPRADHLWRTLIATMQVRLLDGEKQPTDYISNWGERPNLDPYR